MTTVYRSLLHAPEDLRGVVHCAKGIRHNVEVVAETLDEAAALGLSLLRPANWGDVVGTGTNLEIQFREPATPHAMAVGQLRHRKRSSETLCSFPL